MAKISKKFTILPALIIMVLVSLMIVGVVNADSETMSSYIGGTSVNLYAQGYAFDYYDDYNAYGTWASRSIPTVQSTKGFNPASVWSNCGVGGFEIDRETLSSQSNTGYASATRQITYRDISCNFMFPERKITAQCRHVIYHDYGVWEPWTTSSFVVNCTWCDPS
jgi:hypothetical protein